MDKASWLSTTAHFINAFGTTCDVADLLEAGTLHNNDRNKPFYCGVDGQDLLVGPYPNGDLAAEFRQETKASPRFRNTTPFSRAILDRTYQACIKHLTDPNGETATLVDAREDLLRQWKQEMAEALSSWTGTNAICIPQFDLPTVEQPDSVKEYDAYLQQVKGMTIADVIDGKDDFPGINVMYHRLVSHIAWDTAQRKEKKDKPTVEPIAVKKRF